MNLHSKKRPCYSGIHVHKTQKSATATENISDREKINIHQSISHQGCDMTIKHYTIINRNIKQYV